MSNTTTFTAGNKKQRLQPEDITCPEKYEGWSLSELASQVPAHHYGFACEFVHTGVKSKAYARHIAGDPNKKNCSGAAGVLIKSNAGVRAVIAKAHVFNLGAQS